jgi:hypothetical protein
LKRRMVICDIDSICRLLQDYCGKVGFPDDAKPVKFMFNQQERKLAVIVESDEWVGPQNAEMVRFDLQRIYTLGGSPS